MRIEDLEVYRIAGGINKCGWDIYTKMKSEYRFGIGQQFIRAIDSIGANIAEGFGGYHYLDSVKFYYNARGSLWESKYWVDLLHERDLIQDEIYKPIIEKLDVLGVKINNFIFSIKSRAHKDKNNNKYPQ
ncbi:MAG: four helix bundle protein [Candidatus Brocadia sp.]|nr:four helix bundle protein [Candidatus Brocadia sp.]